MVHQNNVALIMTSVLLTAAEVLQHRIFLVLLLC